MKDVQKNWQFLIEELYSRQCESWPLLSQNVAALGECDEKTHLVGGRMYKTIFNRARVRSAAAKVSDGKVDRPCFLCRCNRPKEQESLLYVDEISKHEYEILVNPFPITHRHFTIVSNRHEPQSFENRVGDMQRLAEALPDYLIFFNGAKSGASAPDHMHFQAVPQKNVPLLDWPMEEQVKMGLTRITPQIECADQNNILCFSRVGTESGNRIEWITIQRFKHRPWQYAAEKEEERILVSPASLEFAGLMPLSRWEDFERVDAFLIDDILSQTAVFEPIVRVGIMSSDDEIVYSSGGEKHHVQMLKEGRLLHDGVCEESVWVIDSPFTLYGVTIGKEFHWQQKEEQTFAGTLHIVAREGALHAINYIPMEDYLKSVISSEMKATNHPELLKTHAIISRSWVLRQMQRVTQNCEQKHSIEMSPQSSLDAILNKQEKATDSIKELIYWFDGEAHTFFDVCADDHCQRYQGLTRITSDVVPKAVEDTRGEVLMDSDGAICDARFSKCCGGVSERFDACWQYQHYEYLSPIVDADTGTTAESLHLDREEEAARWIEDTSYRAFCNTSDDVVLSRILNHYDQTTRDFYRWEVRYTQDEISDLIEKKMHLGLGEIEKLTPLKRGVSGRIIKLKVEGDKGCIVLGKELVIRKALSESHLYSSAFIVREEWINAGDDLCCPQKVFVLKGAGWGHGVGLCQIGAAVMSESGYPYRKILNHYFRGAEIKKIY